MAKFEERKVSLGESKYDAPEVTIRRVDLNFGKISATDPRVRPYYYLDPPVPAAYHDGYADMIIHCVTHDIFVDGVTWNGSIETASRPDKWCSTCKRLRGEHAPVEAKLKAAERAKRDAREARYPVSKRWDESEAEYAERLDHAKVMVRKSYPRDIEITLQLLASDSKISGVEVLKAMIDARYGEQDRETINAIVARRVRLKRQRPQAE